MKKNWLGILIFLGTFALYASLQSPGIYGGDSGDLVTAAFTKSVAHPPGYPLYTTLGWLVSRLPVKTIAYRLGFLSSLPSALTVWLIFLIVKQITKSKLAALVASLSLAFSYLFWLYAEVQEVFALHTLLATASWYWLLAAAKKPQIKYFFGLAFLLGLAGALHHTYILILPAMIYWAAVHFAEFKKLVNFGNLLGAAFCFLLGFSFYLYVFLDSSGYSPLTSGPVRGWDGFQSLVLRRDYGTFKAYPGQLPTNLQRIQTMESFFRLIWSDFFLFGIALAIAGIFWLSRKNRPIFYFTLIWFLFAGPLFQFAAGFPMRHVFIIGIAERFLILTLPVVALWLGAGVVFLAEKSRWLFRQAWFPFLKEWAFFLPSFLLLYPLFLMWVNIPKVNFQNFYDFDILAENYLNSLPQGGVFLPIGDTPVYITQYAHFAKGVRPDVAVCNFFDLNGLRYYQQFRDDQFFSGEEPDFYRKGSAKIKFFDEYLDEKPVFTNLMDPAAKDLAGYELVPWGLIYRFYPTGKTPPLEEIYLTNQKLWAVVKPLVTNRDGPLTENYELVDIMEDFEIRLMELGNYFFSRQDYEKSRYWFNKIFDYHPDSLAALQAIAFSFLEENQCEQSLTYLKKAYQVDSNSQKTPLLEARVYRDCLQDEKGFERVSQEFETKFGQKIEALLPE